MTKDEALKLLLEALEINLVFLKNVKPFKGQEDLASDCVLMSEETITAIKEDLAKEKALQALHDENERLGLYKDAYAEQEPVAWMFQHEETGRMNYVSNDGIHNPAMFLEMNPRYALVCPLYTTPPQRKPQEFVCSTGLCHYRKPLTNDRAHQILLDMAKHIETFGDENITEQALSAECIRFILERVTAYGIKEEV